MVSNKRNNRQTPTDLQNKAITQESAADVAAQDRQDERNDLVSRVVAAMDHLRTNTGWDARHPTKLELIFATNGSIHIGCHSKVFPSFQHHAPSGALDVATSTSSEALPDTSASSSSQATSSPTNPSLAINSGSPSTPTT